MNEPYTFGKIVKAKLKATAFHGLLTVFVFLVTAPLIFLVWYPQGMTSLAGGIGLYKIILGVEICLGPLMSLVIFNPAKPIKELIRDYCIVGAIQITALCYGLYTSFIARPVYIVYVLDRLEVVRAVDLEKEDLLQAGGEFRDLPLAGPQTICVEMPTDAEERSDLIFSGLAGKDIHLIPKYYRICRAGEIFENGEKLELLMENLQRENEPGYQVLTALSEDQLRWLPITSRFGAQVALISESGIVSYINKDPFF